jgi:hypothetical protein
VSAGTLEAERRTARRREDRPDLLVRPGATWGWWKQIVLRAPGFPATGVSRLAAPSLARRADELAAATTLDESAWAGYRREFDRTTVELASILQETAASDRFRRAVAWQNHVVLETALDPFLQRRPGAASRNRKHRDREQLVAMYWQRYCVKNDSIGFFGPIGWGRIDAAAAASRFSPGERLVESSDVFFEPWAIDRLADVLSADPRMRRWTVPRRVPFLRVDGEAVELPASEPVPATPAEAAVLSSCDGTTAACDIARRLGVTEEEVELILAALAKRRWIVWKIEVPVGPRPEDDLRRFLESVGDDELRDSALSTLDELTAARDRVRSATGDAKGLRAALLELDATFTEVTASAASRNPGRTYGGRTLLYLDCRRGATLRLGRDVVDAAAPLDLLAESARWVCFRLSEELRPVLLDAHRRLADGQDGEPSLATFWFECLRPVGETSDRALAVIEADLLAKWGALLDLDPEARRAVYSAAELRPGVEEAFYAPASGWAGARYCSPDVLIAAPSLADVERGDFELVVGDFHLALNSQRSSCFVTQHPRPNELLAFVDRDFPQPRLLPVLPKESPPRLSARTQPVLVRPCDFLVAHSHHTVRAGRARLVPSAEVAVAAWDNRLLAVMPTGEAYDVLDVLAEILMDAVVDRFRIVPEWPHTPRVVFDKLVVARETWRFDVDDLTFASQRDEARRFVEARSWRARVGLPPRVFVKSSREMKPFFVDFDSPVYVEALARAVRAEAADPESARRVRFVEMLPTLEQLWLVDSQRNRYTAELRLVGVDLLAPAA